MKRSLVVLLTVFLLIPSIVGATARSHPSLSSVQALEQLTIARKLSIEHIESINFIQSSYYEDYFRACLDLQNGNFKRGLATLEQLLLATKNDVALQALILDKLLIHEAMMDKFDHGVSHSLRLKEIGEQRNDETLIALSLFNLITVYLGFFDLNNVEKYSTELTTLANKTKTDFTYGLAHLAEALLNSYKNDWTGYEKGLLKGIVYLQRDKTQYSAPFHLAVAKLKLAFLQHRSNAKNAARVFQELENSPSYIMKAYGNNIYFELSRYAVTKGQFQQAIDYLMAARKIFTKHYSFSANQSFLTSIQQQLGFCYYSMGEYTLAAQHFYRAIYEAPSSFDLSAASETVNQLRQVEQAQLTKEIALNKQLQQAQKEKLAAKDNAIRSFQLILLLLAIVLLLIIAFSIILYQKQRKLFHLSTTDQLTQLANRDYALKSMMNQLSTTSYLLLMDIDNFKQINDTLGHLVGDLVLKNVATAIRSTVRETDITGRYGGEEFLVFIPTADDETSQKIAERIREAVESMPWNYACLHPTVSIGLTRATGGTVETLLKKADDLMYEAKHSGKNRVCHDLQQTTPASL